MEICTFHSHLDRTMNFHTFLLTPWGTWDHKRPSGLLLQNGYHFTIDRWFIRPSLLLSHSHQEDTFEKNLLHFMPFHAIIAGLGDTFRACGVKRGRRWIEDEPNLVMHGRLRMDPGGWNPSRSDDVTHVTGVAPLTPDHELWCRSFVGLFGVSMNHRRRMTFIAGSKSALVGWLTNLLGNRWIHWWYGVHRLVFVGDWTLLIAITSLGCPSNFATCLTALVINYCWHLRMNPWNAVFISEDVEFYIFY